MSESLEYLRQLDSLLVAALELPRGERERFVRLQAGEDAPLAADLRELLEESANDASLLEPAGALDPGFLRQLAPATAAPSDALGQSLVGARLGAYRLLEELGSGGMGIVFLAERADGQFERQVAVKLLRIVGGGRGLEGRLRRERQILAHLDHPNIARLLDGGVTETGQPYMVMERVQGLRIDRYCEQRDLDARQRLRLFLGVIRAVEAAHRSLVVHRDLKPSNVLVTDDGQPKLLDFGIAALVDPAAGDDGLTRTDLRPMTPEYASPEQIRSLPATTASDVYQLGLTLYRLLTGESAYQVDTGSAAELERLVCETTPRRPSRAALEAGRPEVARALQGDLDNILLKALAKEPEGRYSSAESLRADLERFLENRPVDARRPTLTYRLGRFVRRHRKSVAAAVLLTATALAGLAFHTARVTAERNRARLEAEKASTVKDFLVELFSSSNPIAAEESDLTLRQVLDRGAERIRVELADQPEVRAELAVAIGSAYNVLGLFEASDVLLDGAVATLEARSDRDPVQYADALMRTAALRSNEARYPEQEALLRRALVVDDRHRMMPPAQRASAFLKLGTSVHYQGRYDEAASHFQLATELLESTQGADSYQLADSLARLGWIELLSHRNPLEAERIFRRALEVIRQDQGEDSLLYAEALEDLASALDGQGRVEEALRTFEASTEIERRHLPEADAFLASSLHSLANYQRKLRRFDEAATSFRQSLELVEQTEGREGSYGLGLAGLGLTLSSLGDHDAALAAAEEGVSLIARHFGDDNLVTARARLKLSQVLLRSGEPEAARGVIDEALAQSRRQLGNGHPTLLLHLAVSAQIDRARGALGEAEATLREVLGHAGQARDDEVRILEAGAARILATVLADRQETGEAVDWATYAVQRWQELRGEANPEAAAARVDLGLILRQAGRSAESASELRAGLAALDRYQGEDRRRAEQALQEIDASGV